MKNHFRFGYVPWKNAWFVSFQLTRFTFAKKMTKFDFKSHWNTSIFFHKTIMTSEWNMSCKIVSDFVYALFFDFNCFSKLRNTNFKLYWKYLIFLKKGISCQINIFPSFFCLICIVWHYYRNSFELKEFLMILWYIETRH